MAGWGSPQDERGQKQGGLALEEKDIKTLLRLFPQAKERQIKNGRENPNTFRTTIMKTIKGCKQEPQTSLT